jgi:hypothetical protein
LFRIVSASPRLSTADVTRIPGLSGISVPSIDFRIRS